MSGAGADDTYTPSLWYFQELLFLTDQKFRERASVIWNHLRIKIMER